MGIRGNLIRVVIDLPSSVSDGLRKGGSRNIQRIVDD